MDSGRAFYAGLLEALTMVMGSAKGYLRDHGPMVAVLASQLGKELGLSKGECSELFFAAVLSDMGMVGLAEEAWENPTPQLKPEVRARVEKHPERSEERVKGIAHLGTLAPLIRSHHEWWDGGGYPDRLQADDIPVGARILRLADTVAALAQDRPQRSPLSSDEICDVIQGGIGGEFGPNVARTYLALQRAGEIPIYAASSYRHTLARAAEHLLPEKVSPLSTEQLLVILANVIDAKDPYTGGHSRRVAALSVAVSDQLGLADHIRDSLWAGGYLHDLGKLSVPLRVLTKNGRLDDDEFAFIKAHPNDGAEILESIPTLQHLTTGARYHHERWDGAGYPEGLSGDRIPIVAQIMAVCDAYDAMTSKRAYRDSLPPQAARNEMRACSGVHFSPMAVEALLRIPEETFQDIRSDRDEAASPTSG